MFLTDSDSSSSLSDSRDCISRLVGLAIHGTVVKIDGRRPGPP